MSRAEQHAIFTVPDTEQGARVTAAISGFFANILPTTSAAELFGHMNERQLGRHAVLVSGAVIAVSEGRLHEEGAAQLIEVHRQVHMTPGQFDEVIGGIATSLVEHGEHETLKSVEPLIPTLRQAFTDTQPTA